VTSTDTPSNGGFLVSHQTGFMRPRKPDTLYHLQTSQFLVLTIRFRRLLRIANYFNVSFLLSAMLGVSLQVSCNLMAITHTGYHVFVSFSIF
jgi:hypothetical protein